MLFMKNKFNLRRLFKTNHLSSANIPQKISPDCLRGCKVKECVDIRVDGNDLYFLSADPQIILENLIAEEDIMIFGIDLSNSVGREGKIYIDDGAGFDELNVIRINYAEAHLSIAVVNNAREVKKIRWDPDQDRPNQHVSLRGIIFRTPSKFEKSIIDDVIKETSTISHNELTERTIEEISITLTRAPSERKFLRQLKARHSSILDAGWLSQYGVSESFNEDLLIELIDDPDFLVSPIFDHRWYAKQFDKSWNYLEALRHYLDIGERSGYSPNPFFPIDLYLKTHKDLAEAIRSGKLASLLEHFIQNDQSENRSAAFYFDKDLYSKNELLSYDGLDASRFPITPYAHYVVVGWRNGLRPNGVFDEGWYLDRAPDAKESVQDGKFPNGFSHFLMSGSKALAYASPFFDPDVYLAAHDDLRIAGANLFQHFTQSGRHEGRVADKNKFGRNFLHYFSDYVPDEKLHVGGVLARDAILSSRRSPREIEVVADAFWRMANPRIAIEYGRDVTLFSDQKGTFHLSGLACLPFARLVKISSPSNSKFVVESWLTHPRTDEIDWIGAIGIPGSSVENGFVLAISYDTKSCQPIEIRLPLIFTFEHGGKIRDCPGPDVRVKVLRKPERSTSKAPVQIFMASYNPSAKIFDQQMQSILDQNIDENNAQLSLIVSDDASLSCGLRNVLRYEYDERVEIDPSRNKLGFIANFERALLKRSEASSFFLFSDQDDKWYPDKLLRLTAELGRNNVVCSYSDMRIVDGSGALISQSFWDVRRPHHSDPVSLACANAVTGAAAAFDHRLAEMLTPFPRYVGMYHDQWLSVLAAALGRIAYVEEPLYDYVQHGNNVLGFMGSRSTEAALWRSIRRTLSRAAGRPKGHQWSAKEIGALKLAASKTPELIQRYVLLSEALRRVPHWSNPTAQSFTAALIRVLERQPYDARALKKYWVRLKQQAGGDLALIGLDYRLEAILIAIECLRDGKDAAASLVAHRKLEQTAHNAFLQRMKDDQKGNYEKKISPLPIIVKQVASSEPVRVNLFLPEINPKTFFGGYYSKIAMVLSLVEAGVPVRILLTDNPVVDYNQIADVAAAFPELLPALDAAELVAIGARLPIEFTTRDALIATTWWSAHIVEGVRTSLGHSRFVYLIQEYEPFTFDLGTWYRGAELSYEFPHDALYSTELLERFFRENSLGQFSSDRSADTSTSLSFRNPIVGLGDTKRIPRTGRALQLLFYARPQAHAGRNMYDFGLAALRKALITLKDEAEGWKFIGVGAPENSSIELTGSHELKLISKLDGAGYKRMLAQSDVGLALMYTPHPSLVPLEMSNAGLLTITNSCMTKRSETMSLLSPNMIVAEADIDAIATQIVSAVRRINRGEQPVTSIEWPKSPSEAFTPELIRRMLGLFEKNLICH